MAGVRIIYLPPGEAGRKQGVDDFLAAGNSVDELLLLATTELREPPSNEDENPTANVPYRATPSGLIWDKPTQNGSIPTPLTNFTARITADVSEDDGAEVKRHFEIEARSSERHARFNVPAAKFASMNWSTEHLGAQAIVFPGISTKDHARAAIQLLSEDVEERRIYTHTGWREVDGVWVYLHGGGAIGPEGMLEDIEVRLDGDLSRYQLPAPPEGKTLRAAVLSSLGTWGIGPDRLVIPQYAATYRAAMGETNFSVHVAGPTGQGKSEVASLFGRHFGAGLDARHLISWESTENALEAQAFALKDAIVIVDDFAPDAPEGVSWNWNSWQQILKAFELLGLALPDTKEETLSKVDHSLARALLEYRNAKKRVDTCRQWLSQAREGRVYASWRQIGAETGRMSCSEPNLQNLHKEDEMRRFVRAPEGKVLTRADYSQMELRILAQLSGDPTMLGAFEKDKDLHRATAAKMYGIPEEEVTDKQRSSAKAISFGIVYGMTPIGLATRLGTDQVTASEMIEQYFLAYPKVKECLDANATRAIRTGVLRTPIGRARRFGEASAMTRWERNEVERQAKNFPIQGCCADGLKCSLLLWERRDEFPGVVPILAVHDELVVEVDEDKAEEAEVWLKAVMVEAMERAMNSDPNANGARVRVVVEARTGKSWAG